MDTSMEDIHLENVNATSSSASTSKQQQKRGGKGRKSAANSKDEAPAPQPDAPLDPIPFRAWVRSTQRKLLALNQGVPQGLSASTDSERATLLTQLSQIYQQISQAPLSLTSQENVIQSSLSILSIFSQSSNPDSSSYPNLLLDIFNLHDQATRSSNGSTMDPSAYMRYVSLVLHWHYQWASIDTSKVVDEEEEETATEEDPLLAWTNTSGGPRLETRSGAYSSSSLPSVMSQSNAKAAGVWEQLEAVLGEEAVRNRVREAYTRIALEGNQSHLIWNLYRDFELAHLLKSDKSEERIELVKQVYLARLRIPSRSLDKTFQDFSSFVSTYLSTSEYESSMASTQQIYSVALKVWREREKHEDSVLLNGSHRGSYASWKPYIRWSANKKKYDSDFISSLYERCILDTQAFLPNLSKEEVSNPPSGEWEENRKKARSNLSKAKKHEESQIEKTSRDEMLSESENIWEDYILYMSASNEATLLTDVCSRSVRSRPDSGVLWAHYLRVLSKLRRSKAQQEEVFGSAISGGMMTSIKTPVDSLVSVLLARVDIEREEMATALSTERGIELWQAHNELSSDLDKFMQIYAVQSYCLSVLSERGAGAGLQDEELRLEKCAATWLERGGEATSSLASSIWETALQLQPNNCRVSIEASRFYSKHGDPKKARNLLKLAAGKGNMTHKEEILVEWQRFEHAFGSVNDVQYCRERCKKESEKMWEAWYASQQQMHALQAEFGDALGYPRSLPPVADAEMEDASTSAAVDTSQVGQKRKAVDELPVHHQEATSAAPAAGPSDDSKKGKMGDKKQTRDRENCSVLVSGLAASAIQADLYTLFKGCGEIVEIDGPKVTRAGPSIFEGKGAMDTDQGQDAGLSAAVVEFSDRSAIPAARTKDKKKVNGSQISISLGWECTLFVTNFSEAWTDSEVRRRFSKYGDLFGVRWPSKKFQASRRFCYVQFTEASAAQAALGEHGQETIPGQALQVLLSDPSRKKTRSDANADDKELYVSALPRSAQPEDIRKLFEPHGQVEAFRMPTYPDGKYKGIAFIDYSTPLEAQVAIGKLNGYRLSGKEIKVSLVDKNRSGQNNPKIFKGKAAEEKSRSLRVLGLPHDAKEPLIQQLFESLTDGAGSVSKVQWTEGPEGRGEAVVEFSDAAIAGRVLLLPSISYESSTLRLSSLDNYNRGAARSASVTASDSAMPAASSNSFMPRVAAGRGRGRGRGGLGFVRPKAAPVTSDESMQVDQAAGTDSSGTGNEGTSTNGSQKGKGKSQYAFRQMLKDGK